MDGQWIRYEDDKPLMDPSEVYQNFKRGIQVLIFADGQYFIGRLQVWNETPSKWKVDYGPLIPTENSRWRMLPRVS